MEGGEAGRPPRDGGVRDEEPERHHRGHLSRGRQYGESPRALLCTLSSISLLNYQVLSGDLGLFYSPLLLHCVRRGA